MAYAHENDDFDEVDEGFGTKLRNFFGNFSRQGDRDDRDPQDMGRPWSTYGKAPERSGGMQINTVPQSSITVMPAATFSDAQKVADRLKQGEPQIVNFERTTVEMSERLLDFLNGVTYGLDGYVERVGDRVYLFTPVHVEIHAETPEQPQRSFFDRH